ncbi:dienelactone hydrolase family protein [Pelagibius sp.]|uniref:dienelactone hydrolase family protein n=1 Tax=Pelagibius sp. TaxID=1931238 RepID=UPI00262395AC|nr:dienelactone hydrolase family protein [Pelagibius sp.]
MGDDLERKAVRQTRAGDRQLRLLVSLIMMLAAGACVARPAMVEVVAFESRSYGFVDQLLAGKPGEPQQAEAVLVLPEDGNFKAPYPALVLLHTSNGQGSQDWLYAQRLREEGVAVLAIDSFSPRDVDHTVRDQTLVSTASMLADAYAGLRFLLRDPRIDPRLVGVIGFSKGGIAALYAGYESIREKLAMAEARFALHIAYYPWCGLRLRRPVTTGAPILIQSGALDDLVPPERCAELAAATRGPEGPSNMTLVVHPGARHAFDHPLLELFGKVDITAPSPAFCELEQQEDGGFVETRSGREIDAVNLAAVLAGCSRSGHAGGNEAAAEQAYRNTLAFLGAAGFLKRR